MQKLLSNQFCTTVQAQGWSGLTNGDLLQRSEAEFYLFITSDQAFATNKTSPNEA